MPLASATAKRHPSLAPSPRQICASLRFNSACSPQYFHYRGYRLAYAEFGAPNGTPVFYFHDAGSSRLEAGLFHQSAQRDGFRVIALDRPGIGKSEFYRYGRPGDFSSAVLALAGQLGLEQFGVMSLGAGGLFALSLARSNPDRVMFMLSLAGVPGSVFNESTDKITYTASCWNELTPFFVRMMVSIRHRFFRTGSTAALKHLQDHLCAADRQVLSDHAVFRILARDHEEALSAGYKGIAQDLALCYRKLDFRLEEVPVPTMIWQGETDRLSQRADCEYMAARMPDVRYHRVADRGHFFFVHKMNRVFDELRVVLSNRHARTAA